jgi:outer membrane protein assembly factor BamB
VRVRSLVSLVLAAVVFAVPGALLWSQSSSGSQSGVSPTVANGVAYYAASDSTLRAWNAATGTLLWSRFIGNFPVVINGSPVITGGIAYVGRVSGGIYAIFL